LRRKLTLVRGLTLIPATALIVTNVIGAGVFVKARVMTCNVGTPWMVLLAYFVAGILTLGGALTVAEMPRLARNAAPMKLYCPPERGIMAHQFSDRECSTEG